MKRNLTPAELGEQAARREYLQSLKPEPMKKISKDFKVARPKKFSDPLHSKNVATAEYYGMQECAELVDSRWEYFVSMIRTKALFEKRVEEYNKEVK